MGCFAIQNLEKASVIVFVPLLFFFLLFHKELSHDILCNSRSDFTTAEPPEPLDSFAAGFSFCKTSLPKLVGSAARLFQCILCILWFEISCSFVPFVVTENIWLRLDRSRYSVDSSSIIQTSCPGSFSRSFGGNCLSNSPACFSSTRYPCGTR